MHGALFGGLRTSIRAWDFEVFGWDLDVASVVPLVKLEHLILGAHRVEGLLSLGAAAFRVRCQKV